MRNRFALGALAIAATLIASKSALAQECPTPEQMKAQLAEAIRTGDIVVVMGRESGQKAMELFASPGQPRRAAERTAGPVKSESGRSARIESLSPADPRVDYDRLLPFGE
jgi:hypothetical protein